MTQPLLDVYGRNYGIRKQPLPDTVSLTQSTWHINAVTGSDTNDGKTAATALKTLGSLISRWGGPENVLQPPGPFPQVSVIIDSDLPSTDPLNAANLPTLGEDVALTFRGGFATTIFAGTLTAVTALNRPANQAITLTDVGAPWGANFGKRIRNTTAGVRLNSIAGVGQDLGAGVTEASRPWKTLIVANIPVFLAAGAFAALDTFVIEDVPRMTIATVKMNGLIGISGALPPTINFLDLDLEADINSTPAGFNIGAGCGLQFFACRLPSCDTQGGAPTVFNCIFKDFVFRTEGVAGAAVFGGLVANPFGLFSLGGVGGSMIVTFDLLSQGAQIQLFGVMLFDDVQINDAPGHALATNPGVGFAFIESVPFFGTGKLYGQGNGGAGMHLGSNASFVTVAANMTITGAAGDFECGAVGPLVTPDPATNTNTAAVAQLWANIPIARPAGFGGTVVNPSNYARILPFVP